ncbi:2-oxoglutarate dehydrogenase complex E2 component [Orbilia blumenaviensis]|uniref:dihydrolipoyllysine-residue succinyltransferase n=2 Tax=Orbilia blumenaviensis TaxID=1796055 RepID=A0AAV9VJ09_9PEZI
MSSSAALRSTALRSHRLTSLSHLRTTPSTRLFHVKAPVTGLISRQSSPRSSQVAAAAASHPLSSLQQWRSYADSVTIKVPPMAESISEGTLKQWLKEVGDQVEQDEEIATIETDKIDVAVNAPQAGVLKELLVEADTTVTVGQDLAKLEPGEGAPKPAKEESKKEEPKKEESKPAPPPKSESSQPAEKAPEPPKKTQEQPKKDEKPASQGATSAPAADGIGNRGEQRVKMNRMRLRTGERLKQSQNTAASLTTFNEVDMSAVMEMRSLYKEAVQKKTGVKLGFVSFFTKACILAMKDVPVVNASIEGPNGGDTIVYRDYVDVSIAVATEKGLVTPVIRNAESLDLVGIDHAIAELGEKARSGKITLEDLAGGTFTISNGGVFGSLMGTPIINLPQSAVLGLHATKQRPVVVNGKIEIRPMMYLALTYDHRLLDGREAVTFLVKVKEYIEDPRRMLLP